MEKISLIYISPRSCNESIRVSRSTREKKSDYSMNHVLRKLVPSEREHLHPLRQNFFRKTKLPLKLSYSCCAPGRRAKERRDGRGSACRMEECAERPVHESICMRSSWRNCVPFFLFSPLFHPLKLSRQQPHDSAVWFVLLSFLYFRLRLQTNEPRHGREPISLGRSRLGRGGEKEQAETFAKQKLRKRNKESHKRYFSSKTSNSGRRQLKYPM